ncbi:hypothetical protein BV898_15148 [Hypsibius exemplaris]|uniref:PNPLA domain-containing protein n=1 Tax=Hypsibius exemplaris TaxID=2072580 RepID=A0A9X6NCF6_HYPEX|nr:hypothetical protein BV898_15148 [Hypsibius exemplaris]
MTELWSTDTAGHPGSYLCVQNDGNMVILNSEDHKVWESCTHINSLPNLQEGPRSRRWSRRDSDRIGVSRGVASTRRRRRVCRSTRSREDAEKDRWTTGRKRRLRPGQKAKDSAFNTANSVFTRFEKPIYRVNELLHARQVIATVSHAGGALARHLPINSEECGHSSSKSSLAADKVMNLRLLQIADEYLAKIKSDAATAIADGHKELKAVLGKVRLLFPPWDEETQKDHELRLQKVAIVHAYTEPFQQAFLEDALPDLEALLADLDAQECGPSAAAGLDQDPLQTMATEPTEKADSLTRCSEFSIKLIITQMLLKMYHDTFVSRFVRQLRSPSPQDSSLAENSHTDMQGSFLDAIPSVTCGCFDIKCTSSLSAGTVLEVKSIESIGDVAMSHGHEGDFNAPETFVLHQHREEAERRMATRAANGKGLRIVVLDGGGVRGLVQAMTLHHLQRNGLHSLLGSFDLICGSSAGGIIALYLVYGAGRFKDSSSADGKCRDWKESDYILQMAESLPAIIFPQTSTFIERATDVVSCRRQTMYDPADIEGLMGNVFRGALMSETSYPKCFVMTNRTLEDQYRKCIFSNYGVSRASPDPSQKDSEVDLNEAISSQYVSVAAAARMTSAAPVVFPPVAHDRRHKYEDGGLQENSPINQAMVQAHNIWPDRDVEAVVSLGTGFLCQQEATRRKGCSGSEQGLQSRVKELLTKILTFATDSELQWSRFVYENQHRARPVKHVLRLNVELLEEVQLFESNEEVLKKLKSQASEMLEAHEKDAITSMVNLLNDDGEK